MKFLGTLLAFLALSSPAFSATEFHCRAINNAYPYDLKTFEMKLKSRSEIAVTMQLKKLVTETYKVDADYMPTSTSMQKFAKFDIVDRDVTAYTDRPVTPFFLDGALVSGKPGIMKVYMGNWALYRCELK